MSAPNREILARFAASLRGHQDGGLLYVGALRELYERDNLPISGGWTLGRAGWWDSRSAPICRCIIIHGTHANVILMLYTIL